mmetsp:Transcript_318/g.591  ORF Transcript_318/g.591 Transcript_318/m.591 type:complete len:116 (+) Transcript_318:1739-2086(+)
MINFGSAVLTRQNCSNSVMLNRDTLRDQGGQLQSCNARLRMAQTTQPDCRDACRGALSHDFGLVEPSFEILNPRDKGSRCRVRDPDPRAGHGALKNRISLFLACSPGYDRSSFGE